MTNGVHELTGRVAVVTGSSSGIGRAIAIELARLGANLVIHGRADSSRLRETKSLAEQLGCETHTIWSDLENEAGLQEMVEEAWGWKNGVDIWVNNAGADVLTGESAELDFSKKLDQLWKVDVRATVILSRLIGARMYEQNRSSESSTILNMGWDQASQGMEGPSGEMFAATKGAIMSFTKSLAQSLAPKVRVNCLAPGWIKTSWGESANDEWSRRAVSESLMARWGTPDDVAQVAAFLCSDRARFISGQIVPINGGFRFQSR